MPIKLIIKEKTNDKRTYKYRILAVDLGYKLHVITYDDYKIAELICAPVSSIIQMDLGEHIVGKLDRLCDF